MKVEIVKRPELRLAAVRHVGSYMRIPEAFQRLNDLVTAAGLSGSDTLLVGVYHDDPSVTPEEKLRSDAGITIPSRTKLPHGLTELAIPAGRYAHTTHKGPYTGLSGVWSQLRTEWVPRKGETLGKGLSYEVYRNTPMNAEPHELVTDVFLSLV